ncbi:MAG: GIY-YIG nuclease family protein [Acidobacteria bacterium]|nr:GIY-YIG nuclease family protein [Acidobacteriota bacterium]
MSGTGYVVYILRCADGTLYTGSTNDLAARERAHNERRGAKYTAGRRPVRVVYVEPHESRSQAQSREYQIKRLTRAQKEALIVSGVRARRRACGPGD